MDSNPQRHEPIVTAQPAPEELEAQLAGIINQVVGEYGLQMDFVITALSAFIRQREAALLKANDELSRAAYDLSVELRAAQAERTPLREALEQLSQEFAIEVKEQNGDWVNAWATVRDKALRAALAPPAQEEKKHEYDKHSRARDCSCGWKGDIDNGNLYVQWQAHVAAQSGKEKR